MWMESDETDLKVFRPENYSQSKVTKGGASQST
jgi:hypothetical protein